MRTRIVRGWDDDHGHWVRVAVYPWRGHRARFVNVLQVSPERSLSDDTVRFLAAHWVRLDLFLRGVGAEAFEQRVN